MRILKAIKFQQKKNILISNTRKGNMRKKKMINKQITMMKMRIKTKTKNMNKKHSKIHLKYKKITLINDLIN